MWRVGPALVLLTITCSVSCDVGSGGGDPSIPRIGGPVSDFPHAGDGMHPVDGGGGQVHEPGPGGGTSTPPGGVTSDAGSSGLGGLGGIPAGGTSGGTIGGTTAGTTGGIAGGATGGADVSDGGVGLDGGVAQDGGFSGPDADAAPDAAAGDAGEADGAAPDAGELDAGPCQSDSEARVDGGCTGSYCAVTLDLLSGTAASGACTSPAALARVCEGALARKAAQCTQDHALSLGLGSAVRGCLRRDPELAAVGRDCLDCYVDEVLCTLASCFTICVTGFEEGCESCRRAFCGAAFTRCSGLPQP